MKTRKFAVLPSAKLSQTLVPHDSSANRSGRRFFTRSTSLYRTNRPLGNSGRLNRPGQAGSLLSLGVGGSPPHRDRQLCRKRSRSSGDIFSHCSAQRRRRFDPRGAPLRKPPNRIRHRTSNPSACQNPIMCQPKSGGRSQFHNRITISPNTQPTSTMTGGTSKNIHHFLLIAGSSFLLKLFIYPLQSRTQVQHRIAFA